MRSGGCAYVYELATLSINGSHFNGCTAATGGCIYTQPGAMLQITESVVERGFASSGGVLLAYGMVYAANSTFRDSIATAYSGGLFILGSSASFMGEDLVLRDLSGQSNAAVAAAGLGGVPPTLSMRRVAIENCHAEASGSIRVADSILDLQEVVVTQSSHLDIERTAATITSSAIANCTDTIEGGCIWMFSSLVTVIEAELKGCTAPRGGAIFSASQSRLALRNVLIADSAATEGSGGAALFVGSSFLDANTVTIANCTAADDGGAVAAVDDSRVSLGGASSLEGNIAAGPGGAVSVHASKLYVAPRCTFVVRISVEIFPRAALDKPAHENDNFVS